MDGLELLKKDWQKKGETIPKLSYNEIYQMIWKKSSSVVKWLFYISIGELLFWIILNIAPFFWDTYKERFGEMESGSSGVVLSIITTLTFVIIAVFIFYLYKSYKAISTEDSIRELMKNILKTRKIIKYYVICNLGIAAVSVLFAFYQIFTSDPKAIELLNTIKNDNSEFKFWLLAAVFFLLVTVLMFAFIWFFYKLIYGILLKRLNENYKELKQLRV